MGVMPWEIEDAPEHWVEKIRVVARARRAAAAHLNRNPKVHVSPDDFSEF